MEKEVKWLRESLKVSFQELEWYRDLATRQEQKIEAIRSLLEDRSNVFILDVETQILNIIKDEQ